MLGFGQRGATEVLCSCCVHLVGGNEIYRFQMQSVCVYFKDKVTTSVWKQLAHFALGALRLTDIFSDLDSLLQL